MVTPPCGIPPFPLPDAGVQFQECAPGVDCLSQQDLELLATWVDAVAAWREAVLSCAQVKALHVAPKPTGIQSDPVTPAAKKPSASTVKSVFDEWDAIHWPADAECARLH